VVDNKVSAKLSQALHFLASALTPLHAGCISGSQQAVTTRIEQQTTKYLCYRYGRKNLIQINLHNYLPLHFSSDICYVKQVQFSEI